MSFQRLDAGLVLIVPDLDESVVGAAHQVRFVSAVIVVDTVHSLFVSVKGEVWRVRSKLPNLVEKTEINYLAFLEIFSLTEN